MLGIISRFLFTSTAPSTPPSIPTSTSTSKAIPAKPTKKFMALDIESRPTVLFEFPSNSTDLRTLKEENRTLFLNKEENIQIQLAVLETYYAIFFRNHIVHGDLASAYMLISNSKPYKICFELPLKGYTTSPLESGKKVDFNPKEYLPISMLRDIDSLICSLNFLNDVLPSIDQANQRSALSRAGNKLYLYQTDGGRLAPLSKSVRYSVADEALIILIESLKNELKKGVFEMPVSSIFTASSSSRSSSSSSEKKAVESDTKFGDKKEAVSLFDPSQGEPITPEPAYQRLSRRPGLGGSQ